MFISDFLLNNSSFGFNDHRRKCLFADYVSDFGIIEFIEVLICSVEDNAFATNFTVVSILLHVEDSVMVSALEDDHVICFLSGLCRTEYRRNVQIFLFLYFSRVNDESYMDFLRRRQLTKCFDRLVL